MYLSKFLDTTAKSFFSCKFWDFSVLVVKKVNAIFHTD